MEFVALGLLAVAGIGTVIANHRDRHEAAEQVRRELIAADRRLAGEYQRARRAMNDAAGQSWRNLAG
ncbi:hypothetical protein [Nocardioides humi]|uniref:Uncharacterized protein n=1 Tax=Nocardioides humi TaxID=449461 RepID=A0ABN2A1M0_9ACTN|nr:hypothetical protein [Nocardioides humi]